MIAAPETPSQNDIDVRNKYIIELTQRAEAAESAARDMRVRVEGMEAAIEVLRELDRLYRLRFEIAERETKGINCRNELRIYGEQKKAAWQQSAIRLAALSDAGK